MKIFIDQFCLANGGNESPRELAVNGERQAQSVPLLRGGSPAIFPRGNQANMLTFTVVRQHAGYAAAEAFLFRHAADLPTGGTLRLECGGEGVPAVHYRAAVAVVTSDQGSLAGLVTTHRYRVACGALAEEP